MAPVCHLVSISRKMETESQASFSIGKETGELAVMETIRMDDMDLFEMVNHFF